MGSYPPSDGNGSQTSRSLPNERPEPEQLESVLELCAGGGGQTLGLEWAGFHLEAAVEVDAYACATLRANRPTWRVLEQDIREVDPLAFRGIELIAAGVPCPPFSIAGKQEGKKDERDLFPAALDIIEHAQPAAVFFENVRGLMATRFEPYRKWLFRRLRKAGYTVIPPRVLNAADFGVPQLRPRLALVAFRDVKAAGRFAWPDCRLPRVTVGAALGLLMAERGWPGASAWAARANDIAPTLVGGSKKHGGPDLGPTRARSEWAKLGVDGLGIADAPPSLDFPIDGRPKLTVQMAAVLQGFPHPGWTFVGGKTAAYRQVGNAFPPPVAKALGKGILAALHGSVSDAEEDLETVREVVFA